MNRRQWVMDIIAGKERERIPGSFWFHFPANCQEGKGALDAYTRYLDETDVDFFKVMDETIFPFGFTDISDWRGFSPIKRDDPLLQKQLDLVKLLTDTFGGDYYIPHSIFGPLRTIRMRTSYGFIFESLAADRQAVLDVIKSLVDTLCEYTRDSIRAGADGIYYSSKAIYSAGRDVIAEDLCDLFLAYDRQILTAAEEMSPYNILHICGPDVRLERYQNFPCAVINFDIHENDITLRKGRDTFGKVVLGGMPNLFGPLVDGTDEEIADMVRDLVAEYGDRDGLLFGASCTLPDDVDYHRLRVAMDTLHSL
ncbi:hypothetical protein LJC20_07525 [Eubacteriales bacterium OttesenSCG-928-M02]|nr:hypothetical protein [Eubacteriales bacterium OttesenSCG-928-M02]